MAAGEKHTKKKKTHLIHIHTRFPFGIYMGNGKSRGRRKAKKESQVSHLWLFLAET